MANETKNTYSWKLSNGKTATFTAEIVTTKENNLDGHIVMADCCELHTRIDVEDMPSVSGPCVIQEVTDRPGVVGAVGKIGLVKTNYDKCTQLISSVKAASFEWQAVERKRVLAEMEAEEEHANLVKSGYCFKCGSYCYGDCESN